LLGGDVLKPVFDGSKVDLVAVVEGHSVRVQVKFMHRGRYGQPLLPVKTSRRKPYRRTDFDFLVGYDLETDSAYVFSWGDFENNRAVVAACEEAHEAWWKLSGTQ